MPKHLPLKLAEWIFRMLIPTRSIAFTLLWITGSAWAPRVLSQDPVFSQFYLAPLQLNPGLAGLNENPRFSANYRNQYPGFNQAYRTYAISYDQFFSSLNSGVGLWLLSDDAGDGILKTIKGAGIFSYQLQFNDDLFVKMGAEVGIVQTTLNWDRLLFGDQIDDYLGSVSPGGVPYPTEEIAPEKNTVLYPDLGLGMVMYGENLYGGVSVRHLNRPKPEFLNANPSLTESIPMRWTFHGGASWRILKGMFHSKTKLLASPSIIFVRQGPFQQMNGGITLDAGPVSVGGYFRLASGHSEALIATIGLRTKQLRLGYSFDYTVSGFPLSGGTHEVGILFSLDDGERESRYNDCMQIFR